MRARTLMFCAALWLIYAFMFLAVTWAAIVTPLYVAFEIGSRVSGYWLLIVMFSALSGVIGGVSLMMAAFGAFRSAPLPGIDGTALPEVNRLLDQTFEALERARVGAPRFRHVRVVPDHELRVMADGRRVLLVGAPVLVGSSPRNLLPVLAHEAAHNTRGLLVTYRTIERILDANRRLFEAVTATNRDLAYASSSSWGRVAQGAQVFMLPAFAGVALLRWLGNRADKLATPIRHRTEMFCDEAAARAFGPSATKEALRAALALKMAWGSHRRGGLDRRAPYTELFAAISESPPGPIPNLADPTDRDHPPLQVRTAALDAMTDPVQRDALEDTPVLGSESLSHLDGELGTRLVEEIDPERDRVRWETELHRLLDRLGISGTEDAAVAREGVAFITESGAELAEMGPKVESAEELAVLVALRASQYYGDSMGERIPLLHIELAIKDMESQRSTPARAIENVLREVRDRR